MSRHEWIIVLALPGCQGGRRGQVSTGHPGGHVQNFSLFREEEWWQQECAMNAHAELNEERNAYYYVKAPGQKLSG